MRPTSVYIAIDLGAESGRVLAARIESGLLSVEEIHRFPNEPVRYNGELHWDVPRLWWEIQRGLSQAVNQQGCLQGIGVDCWGLDFALLGADGTLLDNPYHYRDPRVDGMVEEVCGIVPPQAIYSRTGIQFMQVNGLYQLYATHRQKPKLLQQAEQLVTIPDLFNFWLTGVAVCEYTNATTTQFFDGMKREWAVDLLERLGIPTHFLGPVVEPGTVLGNLHRSVAQQVGLPKVPVIAPACHDTGSAVAGTPLTSRSAYISSGTWSLLGTEIDRPILSEQARILNFTNEGGICGTYRLLKNIAGLWLLQSCRKYWQEAGKEFSYSELVEQAEREPALVALIDPDHPSFLHCDDMPGAVSRFCQRTNQPPPCSEGAVTRTVLESLALKYRYVLDALELLTGVRYDELRIVGGGAKNKLLNQFTAEATARRVAAGPIEATSVGNVAVQLLTTGEISSLQEARRLIDRSFPAQIFEPRDPGSWEKAYMRFRDYCALDT